MDKYNVQNDRYCYPNSSVLINKLNIEDEENFENAEREITEISIDNVHYSEPPYNLESLKQIHYSLFSELYDWAGEIRTVDISKGQTRFCNLRRIIPEIQKIFEKLEDENYFDGLSRAELVIKLAEYYADFNMVHPFREGNGRVQRIFFEHIALYNRYNLNWESVQSQDEWNQANIDSVYITNDSLESIFEDILEII